MHTYKLNYYCSVHGKVSIAIVLSREVKTALLRTIFFCCKDLHFACACF